MACQWIITLNVLVAPDVFWNAIVTCVLSTELTHMKLEKMSPFVCMVRKTCGDDAENACGNVTDWIWVSLLAKLTLKT